MDPFQHLLSQSQPFVWDMALEAAFKRSKEKIIEGVASFDVNLITCLFLSPDYSKKGMGWILQQKICSCKKIVPTCCVDGWMLVMAGSHYCNQAEWNYSLLKVRLQLWPWGCTTLSTTPWAENSSIKALTTNSWCLC